MPAVIAAAQPAAASRWRASPERFTRLIAGLVLFGIGEGLLVNAGLGTSPWTVLAQGAARQAGIDVGTATIAVSLLILLAWIPLRQRPGLGSFANALVIGPVIDLTLAVLDRPDAIVMRWVEVALAIVVVAVGSALYLTTFLGPGPRDGLMTGLHRRTGLPIPLVRGSIELTALLVGWALGGTFGPSTVAFALLVGPAVGFTLRRGARGRTGEI
jgi:uncharacterized membrane protein YczE